MPQFLLQFRRLGCLLAALCALAGTFLSKPARALDPSRRLTQYIQTSWSSDSGLPQNSVHAITQTKDGYLWLGTEEGLARFDGVRFQVYKHAQFEGLASDYVRTLFAARDGTLWIGTDSGLSFLQLTSPTPFNRESMAPQRIDGLAGESINAICEDRDGVIWVGSSHGLSRIQNRKLERLSGAKGLPDSVVNALAVDARGILWVGAGNGIFRLEQGQFVSLNSNGILPGNSVTAIAAARDGSVWIGLQGHGIAQIKDGRLVLPAPQLPWSGVYSLLFDRNGSLWIGFDRHGIGRFSNGHLDLFSASEGLHSDRCTRGLFEDREGTLWIGTLDDGVIQLRDGKFAVFGAPEGLSGNYVGNVMQAQDGSMWIGADSNGLNHLLPNGKVEIWDRRKGLPDDPVYSLLQTRNGDIWAGYRGGILAQIHDGKVSTFRDPAASDVSIVGLYEDRDGRLWVGTFGGGLAEFKQGAFRHITQGERTVGITQSADGALWVATDGSGVERILNGNVKRYTSADGLPSDHVMCVFVDDAGNIWAGTASGGLSRIEQNRIVSWTPKQGLPASTIGTILEDHSGHLWMGSDEGILRISLRELNGTAGKPGAQIHATVYATSDGLRTRETLYGSTGSASMDRQGRLWFATIKGAAVINPENMALNNDVTPVWIEGITFDSHPAPVQEGIRLGPGSGNLQVTFTAPSFVAPQQVHFRYRLFGFDPEWTEIDSRRSVWYTNLPPGHYTFQVQAENSDGVWNYAGASLNFTLLPPWSRTPLAFVLYGTAFILIVWAVIRFRTHHFRRRQRELESTVAERTSQLQAEKKALESTRRELQIQATHDALTGLYNRRAMMEHLKREMSRAVRENRPLGVLIADLDHFKMINDKFGHLCGDDIIREAGNRFQDAVRSYDIVGRYGGEEFLILCPDFEIQANLKRITALLDAIRLQPFKSVETEVNLTCSLGVGTFDPAIDSPEIREVLNRADVALYAAKNSGRNCARFESRACIEEAIKARS